jgi:hypothetical protein
MLPGSHDRLAARMDSTTFPWIGSAVAVGPAKLLLDYGTFNPLQMAVLIASKLALRNCIN